MIEVEEDCFRRSSRGDVRNEFQVAIFLTNEKALSVASWTAETKRGREGESGEGDFQFDHRSRSGGWHVDSRVGNARSGVRCEKCCQQASENVFVCHIEVILVPELSLLEGHLQKFTVKVFAVKYFVTLKRYITSLNS